MNKIIVVFISIFIISFGLFFYPMEYNILPNSKIIYDSKNIEIWELPSDNKYRHRVFWYEEIPDLYNKSIVYFEDKSFWYNLWISPFWIFRSIYINISNWKVIQWASTISSQFIRNNLWLNENRTFTKKILEYLYSINLNLRYSKKQILSMYANQVYFWYMNYWLKSAAKFYFDKELYNLTDAEIISLITIQKNSTRYDPYKNYDAFRKRFLLLTKILLDWKIIDNMRYKSIINENLILNEEYNNKLPYIADFYKTWSEWKINFIDKSNFKYLWNDIHTTIDYNLSQRISDIWFNRINWLAWKNVNDYWVILLDRKTSDLKVMIWWKEYFWNEWQVNSTLSLRQPWSTIKPFTYLLAFKNYWIDINDSILDLPVLYKTKDWFSYEPQNYSTKFEWEVTYWEALAQSMNVPAIKTLEKVWVGELLRFLSDLWIKSLNKDEGHYWLALTLWDWEVTLYELLRAYSIFSWNWKYCDINLLLWKKSVCKEIVDKKYTDKINEILTSRYLKMWAYPINSALDFGDLNVFFKTGTSRNFRDNWTIWYTDDYIIWVWVGNKDATNMKWVSWATWAWELFGAIVRELWGTTSNMQSFYSKNNSSDFLEIISPLSGQVFKLDKYINMKTQQIKLDFKTNIRYDKFKWIYDNKVLDENFLSLEKWKHNLELQLIASDGVVASKNTTFEVLE